MIDIFNYYRWQDIVDILVVAFVIYQLISIIRGTRSVQMALGLIILSIVYSLAKFSICPRSCGCCRIFSAPFF